MRTPACATRNRSNTATIGGLHTLASSTDLEAAAQAGLDQRRSIMHLARRVVEPDQPGIRPGADGRVRLDRQGEHALQATSGWHRERARGAEDLDGVAIVAIEIELPVDHAAAGMNAGHWPRDNCGEVDWGFPPRIRDGHVGRLRAASRPRSSVTRAKPLSTERRRRGF